MGVRFGQNSAKYGFGRAAKIFLAKSIPIRPNWPNSAKSGNPAQWETRTAEWRVGEFLIPAVAWGGPWPGGQVAAKLLRVFVDIG